MPEEIPDAALKELTPDYLDDFLYDIGVMFNETFEQAPIVSRPLPLGYASYKGGSPKFIRWDLTLFGHNVISFVVSPDVFEDKDKLKKVLAIRAKQFMRKEQEYQKKQEGKKLSNKKEDFISDDLEGSMSGVCVIFPSWCYCNCFTIENDDYNAIADKDKDETEKDKSADAKSGEKNAVKDSDGDIEMAVAATDKKDNAKENMKDNEKYVDFFFDDDDANQKKKVVRKEKSMYVDPDNKACDKSIDELSFWECLFYPPPIYRPYKHITFKKLKAEMVSNYIS